MRKHLCVIHGAPFPHTPHHTGAKRGRFVCVYDIGRSRARAPLPAPAFHSRRQGRDGSSVVRAQVRVPGALRK